MKLTVATWNIWGKAADHEARHPYIVAGLREVAADVVGLVEVWGEEQRSQVDLLAAELGYEFSAYADLAGGENAWGVGLLSHLPLTSVRQLVVPDPGAQWNAPGVALICTLETPSGAVDVACLCEWGLMWSGYGVAGANDRRHFYTQLAETLAASDHVIAPIVMGDFNAPPDSSDLRAMTGKDSHAPLAMSFSDVWERVNGIGEGWTFDGLENGHLLKRPFGRHRIDYILTGNGTNYERLWRANAARVFGQRGARELPPSDHYGVSGELELVKLFP
jgi:endonuclease/exonuclease/phosphatase family metal-dependent hydrolase